MLEEMSAAIHPNPDTAESPLPLADRILLVEDSEDDVALLRRLLAKGGISAPVESVTDGEMAIRWLTEQLADADNGRAVLPRAIVLDLKLPGVFGMEVLRWIRAQPQLRRAVVVICSSAIDDQEVADARQLGADGCLAKYPQPEDLARLLGNSTHSAVGAARGPSVGIR